MVPVDRERSVAIVVRSVVLGHAPNVNAQIVGRFKAVITEGKAAPVVDVTGMLVLMVAVQHAVPGCSVEIDAVQDVGRINHQRRWLLLVVHWFQFLVHDGFFLYHCAFSSGDLSCCCTTTVLLFVPEARISECISVRWSFRRW
uniref:(northern house mosquito) hypothetical protein n=1 Tax=Culex pipiens TaxID=7175 RepID=A0A8D8BQK8_CULPI